MGDLERRKEDFQRLHLDPIRQLMENAQEEYGSWLREYEEAFGEKAREQYEEAHA